MKLKSAYTGWAIEFKLVVRKCKLRIGNEVF